MQPITKEMLEELIEGAKKAGKETKDLEEAMEKMTVPAAMVPPPMGEKKEFATAAGSFVIESTGPARKEDFE